MERDSKFWLSLWLGIALCICLLIFIICNFVKSNNQIAFENGYERQMLKGNRCAVWMKIDKR